MKSCRANNCPAHTRRVKSLAETARKVAFASWRGALVRRRLSRFALILYASLCFVVASRGSSVPTPSAHAALKSPQQTGSSQSSSPGPKTPEQTRTEQYTLSHERQAKAVAYSRAGYTLYFLSYFLGGLFLFLILRLGWAAKFRDIAEGASDKKWIQAFVFVPLLFVTLDVLDLPVHAYWHSLSLHYDQSIKGGRSWLWNWHSGECLSLAFGIVLVLILFAVMRRSPRRWWLYFWFPAVLILLALIVITL